MRPGQFYGAMAIGILAALAIWLTLMLLAPPKLGAPGPATEMDAGIR